MPKPTLKDSWIDPSARKIVQQLKSAGFESYLVGGCVRDLLVGLHPKDYDIATNAHPNEIKKKVPGSYIIGKRFRLVLVKRGSTQFEVATFRRTATLEEIQDEENTITGDNFFGTIEEDARRRDFTVNGLFYDPIDHRLIDHVEGQKDIEQNTIRMIGDPEARLVEDPIRSLRAIRLAHKLQFMIEPELRDKIQKTAPELMKTALPRRREEFLKIMRLHDPAIVWMELYDLGILKEIAPTFSQLCADHEKFENLKKIFDQAANVGIDFDSPIELFSAFLYAYVLTVFKTEAPTVEQIEAGPSWVALTRDELGVFKVEVTAFLSSLNMIQGLRKTESYKKKGHRRQVSFLNQESLPLALKLGLMGGAFDHQTFQFWLEELTQKLSH